MPLALELAAVQVDAFGIRDLARGLTHRFDLLTRGRRTALPRQQTLRATMDWSYDLLPKVEKVVLRRLAAFRGGFTMEAAGKLAVARILGDGMRQRTRVFSELPSSRALRMIDEILFCGAARFALEPRAIGEPPSCQAAPTGSLLSGVARVR